MFLSVERNRKEFIKMVDNYFERVDEFKKEIDEIQMYISEKYTKINTNQAIVIKHIGSQYFLKNESKVIEDYRKEAAEYDGETIIMPLYLHNQLKSMIKDKSNETLISYIKEILSILKDYKIINGLIKYEDFCVEMNRDTNWDKI